MRPFDSIGTFDTSYPYKDRFKRSIIEKVLIKECWVISALNPLKLDSYRQSFFNEAHQICIKSSLITPCSFTTLQIIGQIV